MTAEETKVAQLAELAEKDARIKQLEEAYKNQMAINERLNVALANEKLRFQANEKLRCQRYAALLPRLMALIEVLSK